MDFAFDRDDARRFLERLAPPGGQFLELRVIVPDSRPSQFFCRSVDEALAIAEQHTGRANVYVGACPRVRRGGKKEDVDTVVAFWADLDFHQIAADREEARAIALERLQSFEPAPSMIVLTGNGTQGWWILDEPIEISETWPVERLEGVNRALAMKFGGDSVQDLARVLRVPGTVNLPTKQKRARGCTTVPTSLLVAAGPVHPVGALKSLARHATRKVAPVLSEIHLPPGCRAEVLDAFNRLLVTLGGAHPLTRTWYGERVPRDSSRSGWDWALARELDRAGIQDEYIPDILRSFPRGRGALATDRYLILTIAKARSKDGDRSGTQQPAEA